jgi:hypothetical protein
MADDRADTGSHHKTSRRKTMGPRNSLTAAAVACATIMTITLAGTATAQDARNDAKYPDLSGGWQRFVVPGLGGQPAFDQTKPWGKGQQAPLTPEYQKILEESLADQARGGQGNFIDHALCLPAGMPFMMVATRPLDWIVTPQQTYILIGGSDHWRRIFTDGRDWPKDIEPTYGGYSIGKWIDENGDGKFDVLEVETRGPFKGRRAYDASGLPLHHDNESLFKERIYLDKTDPNLLHDEFTVIDHALTRPWMVHKKYVRRPAANPDWVEAYCNDGTALVGIGKELYYLSGDGMLMPGRKDQPPPDLKYFNRARN